MNGRKPSKTWRLVLSTPGAPIYDPHRSRAAAELAAERHIARINDGASRVTRVRLEGWLEETGTWVGRATLWPQPKETS